jgi:exoribonuclease-2
MLRKDSLVLYKNRPALVKQLGDKLKIKLRGSGKTLKVRPKDVTLLHPGPVQRLGELTPQEGEVETAWEILAGDSTTLAELAELVYGDYTPATAWAAWQLVDEGLYFRGEPDEIVAQLPDQVAQERAAREARAAERRAWAAFLDRVQAGQAAPQDSCYLEEVEELALEQREKSRVMHALGRAESPQNAHTLLLELDYWDYTDIPYTQRLDLITSPPALELPPLPQEERIDLTHLPAFAIDDEGNQDPDDALSLEGERLWVHVADVAALVHPDSAADLEARARGANLYLPQRIVPILPPQATQTLGLGLNEVSPALSFGLDLGSGGEVRELELVPSWVRVARLTYEQVEAQIDEEPFKRLYHLAQTYQARRRENGALFIQLPEVKILVQDGEVSIRPLPAFKSRDLVTEAMLMAGEAAARYALAHDIPIPFTAQDPPREHPQLEGMAGMFALRRALKPSHRKIDPAPHAGLGMELYAQSTSPLRRYLDLVIHQQLRAHLRGEKVLGAQEVLERVGTADAITGSVRRAERLTRRHWTLVYLMQHPRWRGEGVLVEKVGSRGRVLIPELDLEAQVHLRTDLALNSTLRLALSGVNLAELEAHFQVKQTVNA